MSNAQLSTLVNKVLVTSPSSTADFLTTFDPRKYWKLNTNEYETFWSEYCNILQNINDGKYNGSLNIAEKVNKHCPIICDCVVRFQKTDSPAFYNHTWSDEFIIQLVYSYQKAINDFLVVDIRNKIEFLAVVMTNEYQDSDGNYNYGYRIQFPFCRVEPVVQKRLITPKAIQYLRKRNVTNIFPESPLGNWEQMISNNNTDDHVILYGSTGIPSRKPMELSDSIYDLITLEDIENKEYNIYSWMEGLTQFFEPSKHSYVTNKLISSESAFLSAEDENYEAIDLNYYTPFVLSINYSPACTRLKPGVTLDDINSGHVKAYSTPSGNQSNLHETEIEMAEKFLPMLSITRVEDEHNWLDVGKSLYNSDKSDEKERALKAWMNFTERSENRDPEDCEEYWESFGIDNPLTIRTLAFYARLDSKADYDKWHKNKYTPFLERSLSCTHVDVALAFYWIYWLDFTCGSVKNKTWYVFSGNILREADSGREIRLKVSSEFKSSYEILQKELSEKITLSGNELEKTQFQMEIKKIGELIKKLKTVNFISSLLTALLDLFKDDNFARYANTNARLFGCSNGIIECCDKYAVFRSGKPEDYVTLASPIRYPVKHSWESPNVKKFMIWLKQIFNIEDLKNYFLRVICSCLRSKNKEKLMGVLSGDLGNNSKSMIKKLIETVFGPYAYTFPTHAFTTSKKGGASPEFGAARFAKIAFVNEPREDSHLQADEIKLRTGMDKVNDRMLYANEGEYEVMYTLFLVCNKVPLIPGADNAIMNRLRVIPFDSVWSLEAPDDLDEQYKQRHFKSDRDFESKIPLMAPSALWVFVETYREYATKGLGQPPVVTKRTERYFKDNDLYKAFINEMLDPVIIPGSITEAKPEGERDITQAVKFEEVYREFKSWVRVTFPSMKVPDSPLFLFHMNQRLGKPVKKMYRGIKIKQLLATI